MKQIVTKAPKHFIMQEVDIPKIERDTDVLVKIKAAGICGSDVHIYHGTSPVATYPRVMGHEIVGVVDAIGRGVTKIKVGDHVIVDQIVNCGECYPCKIGRINVCSALKVRGVHIDGGYREYMTVPENDLHILPKNLPFTDAVMIEPISISFQAIDRAQVIESDIVFVLGGGALGKSLISALKLKNCTIIVADVEDERLEESKALGANYTINSSNCDLVEEIKKLTGGFAPTVSIDAAGFVGSLSLLADVTSNAGRIITMAFLSEESEIQQVKITAKELDIRGSRLQRHKFKEVIAAYNQGQINLTGLVSHVFQFEEFQKAFDIIDAKDPTVKKIVLTFN